MTEQKKSYTTPLQNPMIEEFEGGRKYTYLAVPSQELVDYRSENEILLYSEEPSRFSCYNLEMAWGYKFSEDFVSPVKAKPSDLILYKSLEKDKEPKPVVFPQFFQKAPTSTVLPATMNQESLEEENEDEFVYSY